MSAHAEKMRADGDGGLAFPKLGRRPPAGAATAERPADEAEPAPFEERVARLERTLICEALARCNGRIAAAARDLKTTPRIVGYRVRKLGIDFRAFRKRRSRGSPQEGP